jgi:nucleotide-binding universal stress UspA family protein
VAKQPYQSLLDDHSELATKSKEKSKKDWVHPQTNFDEDSLQEQNKTEIDLAQRLQVNSTSIVSSPSSKRCVRTIFRGNFQGIQQQYQYNHRKLRKYILATDLSSEAQYAMEWTVGTVLRDADTLLCIYCIDEEVGVTPSESSGSDQSSLREQAAAIGQSISRSSTPTLRAALESGSMIPGFSLDSRSARASPDGRALSKTEEERNRVVNEISDRIVRLLRDTKLQVKVVVEVIHCKSPKHLMCEVIDLIKPTLVILGSRGRSHLKKFVFPLFSKLFLLISLPALFWAHSQHIWFRSRQSR